jgi:hypothetical protein
MPERLPTAAAATLMTLELAFLRRRLWFAQVLISAHAKN